MGSLLDHLMTSAALWGPCTSLLRILVLAGESQLLLTGFRRSGGHPSLTSLGINRDAEWGSSFNFPLKIIYSYQIIHRLKQRVPKETSSSKTKAEF